MGFRGEYDDEVYFRSVKNQFSCSIPDFLESIKLGQKGFPTITLANKERIGAVVGGDQKHHHHQ